MGKPFIDLTNQVFGEWTASAQHKSVPRPSGKGSPRTHWFCTCSCGNTAWVDATNLRQGISTNCGCQRETKSAKQQTARSAAGKANTTHGMSGTPTYKRWFKMKQRCEYPKDASFPYYGAKGIRVCERWQKFENFLADMGQLPSPTHEIERRNHSRDYEPHNCEWMEGALQPRNTSITIRVPSGESLAEYCETHKLDYHAVYDYFVRKHLPLERAVEIVKSRGRLIQ
jgi:hypothetical protein